MSDQATPTPRLAPPTCDGYETKRVGNVAIVEHCRGCSADMLEAQDALDNAEARLVVLTGERNALRAREERWLDMLEERGSICRCEGCGNWLLGDRRVDDGHVRVEPDETGEPIPVLCGPVVEQSRALLVVTCGCSLWSVCPAGPANGGGPCIAAVTVVMHRDGDGENGGWDAKFCEHCAWFAEGAGWERDDGLPITNEEGGI